MGFPQENRRIANSWLSSAKVVEVFQLNVCPEQTRRNLQKLEEHRAMHPGKGQIMFSPPHSIHCS